MLKFFLTLGAVITALIFPVLAEEVSEEVKISDVPAAVQKIILEENKKPHHHVEYIEKVTEDGELRYEVELSEGKRNRSFSVSPDGRIVSWQVFMHEIPQPVRDQINSQVQTSKSKLGDINRITDDEKNYFDIECVKDGHTNSVSISTEGKVLSQQIAFADTPDAVRKAISIRAGNGKIKSIEKDFDNDDGAITYDVTIEKIPKNLFFTLDAKGALVADE